MGCSPSKGQLFAGIENQQDKAPQFGSYESNSHHFSDGTEILSQPEKEIASSGKDLLQEENTAVQLQGKKPLDCDIVSRSFDIGETNVHLHEELLTKENTDIEENRRMKNSGCKRSRQRERLRKTVYMKSLDLPQAIVKVRQAAYAYLEHNIPKYESLLGLLDKATQTQLSIQPMVSLILLQYEQINQVLDEIATEGVQMLEMNRNRMALPEAQNDVLLNAEIPEAERNSESPPDLLQDMLQHSIIKIRLVGESVKGPGDTALEETSDYFTSLSQLLAEKLGAKRAVESRLKQVLACVESYALGKPNLEDAALQSEDSGIGVENECYNKSVRRCSQEESAASRGSTQSSYGCPEVSLPDQPCVNGNEDDDGKDNDAENSNDDKEPKHEQGRKTDLTDRKISNSSQADPKQYPLQFNLQNKRPTISTFETSDKKERSVRRPKTADDSYVSFQGKHRHSHLRCTQRSRSADCLYRRVNDYMVQEQNDFPNDYQKPKWITKRQNPSQFWCRQDENNGPFKPAITPHLIPICAPLPPGKNAVRRLINTFSQGVCDSSNQKPPDGFTRFKGMKRGFLPIIPKYRSGVSTNGNNANGYSLDQKFSERPDDTAVNSLPPPPPEILMDNSFDRNKGPIGGEYGSENSTKICSTQRQKCYVSQCPRTSAQTISVLPSLDSISVGSQNISEICRNGQESSHKEQDSDHPKDKEENYASGLLQQSQTINHLYHSTDILAKLGPEDEGNTKILSERAGGTDRLGNRYSGQGEASALYANSYPPTMPPVSRVQIPQSSYSTCHRGQSPTALPNYRVNCQGESSTASFTSQIQRWTKRDSEDENGLMTASNSMSFYDAYSMFCQENKSAFQSVKPSCRSTLPRPWGEPKVSRDRPQATYLPTQTLKRNIPYRPTLTEHQLLLPSETITLKDGR